MHVSVDHRRVLVRVLGPVDAVVGDRPVQLSALERGLLAVLAARAGHVASVDDIIDALWAEAPPRSARNRVHALVSSIRRAAVSAGAEGGFVETSPPGYRLRGDMDTVDLVGFDNLVERARGHVAQERPTDAADAYRLALGLWRGMPFDGVGALRDPAIQAERTRLQEARLAATEERIDADLSLGRHGQLIGELTALVAAHPLRERLRGQLMLGLFRNGRQADASAVYRAGYDLLDEELGAQPGPELQALHRAILSGGLALDVAAAPRVAALPVAARPVLGLPPNLPDFTGRSTELDRIRAVLAEHATAPIVVSVNGMGGVGKTALSIRAAHLASGSFLDGCLFFDMRGTELAPRTPPQVMVSVLRSLGVAEAAIPGDVDALAVTYRSTMADRRVLLVLDNALEEAQVRPLVAPAPASAVIVTSRRVLAGLDGAHHVALDVLPVADATAMLARLIGAARIEAEPTSADRILEHCGRLPLAVRVVGVRMAQQPELPLARMVDRMADLGGRLDEIAVGDRQIRASLAISFARLDPSTAAVARLAGLLPAPEFPAWAAAALAGTHLADAETALARLADVSLVTVVYDGRGARYRMHDLIRGYGRDRAMTEDPTETREAALRRAYEGLLGLALKANSGLPSANAPVPTVDPGWHDVSDAAIGGAGGPADWFSTEDGLLVGAVQDCVARGWLDLAWRLVVAMTVHASNGDVFAWCELAELVLTSMHRPDRAADPEATAKLSLALGGTLRGRGRTLDAVAALRASRIAYRRLGDSEGAAIAASQLAMATRALTRLRVARAAFDWAIARLTEDRSAQHLAQAYVGLGNLHLDLGALADARAAYERSLEVIVHQPNPSIEANALICLGIVASREQRYVEAAGHYERALKELTAIGDRPNAGRVELGLAEAYLGSGDIEQATRFATRALGTSLDVGDTIGHAQALVLKARLLLLAGEAGEAVCILSDAAGRLERAAHHLARANVLKYLAEAHLAAGDRIAARRSAEEARDLYATLGLTERESLAALLTATA